MLVKVLIKRKVTQEKEAALLDLITQLRTLASRQPGYISGETLRSADNPEEYLVISTWQANGRLEKVVREQGALDTPGQDRQNPGQENRLRGFSVSREIGLPSQLQRLRGGLISGPWDVHRKRLRQSSPNVWMRGSGSWAILFSTSISSGERRLRPLLRRGYPPRPTRSSASWRRSG